MRFMYLCSNLARDCTELIKDALGWAQKTFIRKKQFHMAELRKHDSFGNQMIRTKNVIQSTAIFIFDPELRFDFVKRLLIHEASRKLPKSLTSR